MNLLVSFLTIFLSVAVMALGQSPTRRYLYMSTPDASQKEGRSGNGILIFDIDNGHKFVRRINVPIFEEGLRGFTGNLKTHSVYYSTSNRRVGAFDLERDRAVWDKTYEAGADRKSTRLNSSHMSNSYAVFCLNKKIVDRPVSTRTTGRASRMLRIGTRLWPAARTVASPPTSASRAIAPASVFFFNDPATTEIYTLSLHDALPI